MNMIFLTHQFIKPLAIDKLFKILSPQKITNLSSQKGYQIKIKKTLAKHHKSNSKCITHKKRTKKKTITIIQLNTNYLNFIQIWGPLSSRTQLRLILFHHFSSGSFDNFPSSDNSFNSSTLYLNVLFS